VSSPENRDTRVVPIPETDRETIRILVNDGITRQGLRLSFQLCAYVSGHALCPKSQCAAFTFDTVEKALTALRFLAEEAGYPLEGFPPGYGFSDDNTVRTPRGKLTPQRGRFLICIRNFPGWSPKVQSWSIPNLRFAAGLSGGIPRRGKK
jgi:hypothetical protein